MHASRLVICGTRPVLTQAMQSFARTACIRKLAIDFEQVSRRSTPVQTPKKNRSGRFENRSRSVVQGVGKAHVCGVFAGQFLILAAHGEQPPITPIRATVASLRRLSAHGRGRKFFFGFVDIRKRVFGAFDGVVQGVFVGIDLWIVGADLLKCGQELFRLGFEKF
jgi:hypothetical protein